MIFYLTLFKKMILLLTYSKQYGHEYNKEEAHLHKCNTESKYMILLGVLKKCKFLEKQLSLLKRKNFLSSEQHFRIIKVVLISL